MRESTVSSVMTTEVITVTPRTPFKEVVAVLSGNGIAAVPVVGAQGELVGVVSEADVLAKQEFHAGTDARPLGPARRARWSRARGLCAAEVMSAPVFTIGPGEPVAVAARRMAERRVRRLFVLDADGDLVGVVSRRDVLRTFLRPDHDIRADVDSALRAGLGHVAGRVTVRVRDGVVILDGSLDLHSEALVARGLSWAVPGVVGVVDDLTYRAETVSELDAL
ncbi:MAG TPA: CBS domain-containing protein [Actinophytocola sp.]|uniref:CBS domain-containing protein n=1 Tax=Actinophytocola sp. TaxID=1872138 RepID=UPI002DB7E590|nr:CBS domain-containing protein [Actinophytocola sp.]HEU5474941.1 CBS domain-containing protein [Actinophytocola sp.]